MLRCQKPGARALIEIRHYQCSQTFLIAIGPFQCLVREVCQDCPMRDTAQPLRWQSNSLFSLQCLAEAYMAGFFSNMNLCAHHRKVITIARQDLWLAIELRGRDHIGGRGLTDLGAYTTLDYQVSDRSKKAGLPANAIKNTYAQLEDWPAVMRREVSVHQSTQGKGGKGAKLPIRRRHMVVKDAIHGISRPALCHFARKGGVQRMSNLIYDKCRGVLKVFLKHVIKDIILFTQYAKCHTVTPIDVVFGLKQHGRNIYGFTRPHTYSVNKDKIPSRPAKSKS